MPNGNEVCVVGITETGETIRPVCENGFLKSYLYSNNKLAVYPRSTVEWDFTQNTPIPPHIEDKMFKPDSIRFCGQCNDEQWEQTLSKVSFKSVIDIFQGYLRYKKWVAPGAPTRSIATLVNPLINSIEIVNTASVKSRLIFQDTSGNSYSLPINDLAFRELSYKSIRRNNEKPEDVANSISEKIRQSKKNYLRIGLARPWKNDPTEEERCYPQITGIYTFPDYLDGKNFSAFTATLR